MPWMVLPRVPLAMAALPDSTGIDTFIIIRMRLGPLRGRCRLYDKNLLRASGSLKNTLRDHGVNALGAVHGLSNVEIHRHAAKRIGILARKVLFSDQEIDGFPDGQNQRLVQ